MIGRRLVGRRLRRVWMLRGQRQFDRKFSVDTCEDNLSVDTCEDNREVASHANLLYGDNLRYEPASVTKLEKLFEALPIDPREYAFIDLGCGKGAAMILALERGFQAVIGIEFDRRLSAIAARNLQLARTRRLSLCTADVVNLDAAEYRFPNIPSLIFMFNPFGEDTLRAVLHNIENTFNDHPRELYVAYFYPVHREVLESSTRLVLIKKRPFRSAVYKVF